MPSSASTQTIRVSARVRGFTYAIRNIVAEARKVEAAGRKVRYLNIGDPIPFGFHTPPHLIAAVEKAMRDGHNGYTASVGVAPAREAVAHEYTSRGMPVSADRCIITSGTSEGIELTLGAIADAGDEVLVPTPTYPLYIAVLAKLGARALFYRADPDNDWQPDLDDVKRLLSPKTRALVVYRSEQPDGRGLSGGDATSADRACRSRRRPDLADEVYGDLAFDGPPPFYGSPIPTPRFFRFHRFRRPTSRRAGAPDGWRGGYTERLDDVLAAIKKLADGRLCSGRCSSPSQRRSTAIGRIADVRQRAAGARGFDDVATHCVPGFTCVAPHAAFYVMPQVPLPPGNTDEDYVLGFCARPASSACTAPDSACPPIKGFFRVVFLASPDALSSIYDDLVVYARTFCTR